MLSILCNNFHDIEKPKVSARSVPLANGIHGIHQVAAKKLHQRGGTFAVGVVLSLARNAQHVPRGTDFFDIFQTKYI